MGKNEHIFEYLKYYTDLSDAPGFAVALTGNWGVGKTYVVQKFLEEHLPSDQVSLCVSLYGLSTTADLNAALLKETYPLLNKKALKTGGSILKSAASFFQIDLNLSASDFLELPNIDLFIFEDFERTQIPLDTIMGYLNELVERENAKVLIVVNESELKEPEQYKRKKEKLIGKSLEVQSEFESVLSNFNQNITNTNITTCISKNNELISNIYIDSDANSLRILQQTLLDFERFYSLLSPEHAEHQEALTSIIQTFFSLSFEIKSGRLTENEILYIANYTSNLPDNNDDDRYFAINKSIDRYKGFDISHTIFPGTLLVDILIKGIINKQKIHETLSSSSFFGYKNEKSWKRVWHASTTPNDKFYAALEDMEDKFKKREYIESNDIMHVFGLRLWASNAKILSESHRVILFQLHTYVDDLYSQRIIEPLIHKIGRNFNYDTTDSLEFKEHETKEYKEISEYYTIHRLKAGLEVCKQRATDLPETLKTNIYNFHREVTNRENPDGLGKTSFLQYVDNSVFTDALFSLDPFQLETAIRALNSRYDDDFLSRYLTDEASWLAILAKNLTEKGANDPLDAYRINRLIAQGIKPLFSQSDELKRIYTEHTNH